MGLSSFWSNIKATRGKEVPSRSQPTPSTRPRYHTEPALVARPVLSQSTPPPDKEAKRKSLGIGISRDKTVSDPSLKKRRSWFGGKPAKDEDIPAVPSLPTIPPVPALPMTPTAPMQSLDQRSAEAPSSSTGEKRVSRRKSLARKLSLFRDKSMGDTYDEDARTWTEVNDPYGVPRQLRASRVPTSAEEGDVTRGLMASRRSSLDGSEVQHDSVLDNPSVPLSPEEASIHPAMRRTSTGQSRPLSMTAKRNSYTPKNAANAFLQTTSRRTSAIQNLDEGSIRQSRPLSMSGTRSSFTPQNGANGFLKTTSGRASMVEPSKGTLSMTMRQEQQLEWQKLQYLLSKVEQRRDDESVSVLDSSDGEDDEGGYTFDGMQRRDDGGVMAMLRELDEEEGESNRNLFANANALAKLTALECGVERR